LPGSGGTLGRVPFAVPLQAIELLPEARERTDFPFQLPLVQKFQRFEFKQPVTLLVGRNGSGKSTLLEALAIGAGLPTVGGDDTRRDPTLLPQRELAAFLRLVWRKKSQRGFFLRAEDFFNFSRRVGAIRTELTEMVEEFDSKFTGQGRLLARGAVLGQKSALEQRYDGDLDARSHGESFLLLFERRLVEGGLYLLDEPEMPLSPTSLLGLISLIKHAVSQGSQFVIATHSVILMAYPEAQILSFDQHPPCPTAYDEVEHVQLTRDFLKNPAAFLRRL
jgi:predicted ATPase